MTDALGRSRALAGVAAWRWLLSVELGWYAVVLAVIMVNRLTSRRPWSVAFELMVGVAVVCAAGAVLRWWRPRRVAAVCLAVLAVDVAAVLVQPLGALGPVRMMVSAAVGPVLLAVVARRSSWWALAAALVAAGAGITLDVVRGGNTLSYDLARWLVDSSPTRQFLLVTGVLLVVAPVAFGLVLRSTDAARHAEVQARRAETLARVRVEERLQVAREVHDTVASHVTGIVVHAQAAGLVGGMPEAATRSLHAIETAGDRALTAMRRMVGSLRLGDTLGASGADTSATASEAVRAGVDESRLPIDITGGPPATDVDLCVEADAAVPPDLAVTLRRIVVEAVTNARRHMPDGARVSVQLATAGPSLLTLRITNAVGPSPARVRGGGFGLVGLGERVAAVHGRLEAGPTADGHWRLDVELPIPAVDSAPPR